MFGEFIYVTLHVDNLPFYKSLWTIPLYSSITLKLSNLDSHGACLQLGLPSIWLCEYSTYILVNLCLLFR